MPDRLPSLIVLVGFWLPPAVAGWVAAGALKRESEKTSYVAPAIFVFMYAAAWFRFNLHRMPPYIPGATMDPTYAAPEAVVGLAVVAAALVLPGSAVAFALAFRRRRRLPGRSSTSSAGA